MRRKLSGQPATNRKRRVPAGIGIGDQRVVSYIRIQLDDAEVEVKVGGIDFYSRTIRAFKLDSLEDSCEDYGQLATYLGTVPPPCRAANRELAVPVVEAY
jgi:hypothetical protein